MLVNTTPGIPVLFEYFFISSIYPCPPDTYSKHRLSPSEKSSLSDSSQYLCPGGLMCSALTLLMISLLLQPLLRVSLSLVGTADDEQNGSPDSEGA